MTEEYKDAETLRSLYWDNRMCNLELMTHSEHTTHHNLEREFSIGDHVRKTGE